MIGKGLFGIFSVIFNKIFHNDFISKLQPVGLNLNDCILDVGAGNGERILKLYKRGFNNLLGVDPFIKADLIYNDNVKILKKDLNDIDGEWDFIMLNHVFEHMPDPENILKRLNQICKKGRIVLIRIPVAQSYSWEYYRNNWVALDPPRHFFLHTRKSMEILASCSGFTIKMVKYDSMEYQFIGSEQLKAGIKLQDERSYFRNKNLSIFSESDISRFKKKAMKLNRLGKGDAACFYLVKD